MGNKHGYLCSVVTRKKFEVNPINDQLFADDAMRLQRNDTSNTTELIFSEETSMLFKCQQLCAPYQRSHPVSRLSVTQPMVYQNTTTLADNLKKNL